MRRWYPDSWGNEHYVESDDGRIVATVNSFPSAQIIKATAIGTDISERHFISVEDAKKWVEKMML